MPPVVEQITPPLWLGEGPHWDIPTQTLYFVDVFGAKVHSYRPSTKQHHSATVGDGKYDEFMSSFIIPVEGQQGKFVISLRSELAVICWDGKSANTSEPQVIFTLEPLDKQHRLNDAKVDSQGRLWTGTMLAKPNEKGEYPSVGSIYCIDGVNKHITKFRENQIMLSNGIAWRSDQKKMYYNDSPKNRVDSFDFNEITGDISNEKTVFNIRTGTPDGLTIDAEDKIFVATYGTNQVLRVDPDKGQVVCRVEVPAHSVTSVAFGGPNLDELYITTGNFDAPMFGSTRVENGINGALFRVTGTGFKGRPMHGFRLSP